MSDTYLIHICNEGSQIFRISTVILRKNENTHASFVSHVADDEIVDSVSLLPPLFRLSHPRM